MGTSDRVGKGVGDVGDKEAYTVLNPTAGTYLTCMTTGTYLTCMTTSLPHLQRPQPACLACMTPSLPASPARPLACLTCTTPSLPASPA